MQKRGKMDENRIVKVEPYGKVIHMCRQFESNREAHLCRRPIHKYFLSRTKTRGNKQTSQPIRVGYNHRYLLSASSRSHGVLVAASTITVLEVVLPSRTPPPFPSTPLSIPAEAFCSSGGERSTLPPPVTPSICTISSVLTLRLASCSPSLPLDPARESISSKKIVLQYTRRRLMKVPEQSNDRGLRIWGFSEGGWEGRELGDEWHTRKRLD